MNGLQGNLRFGFAQNVKVPIGIKNVRAFQWRKAHPEKCKEYKKRWYKAHPEYKKEEQKRYREKQKELGGGTQKKYDLRRKHNLTLGEYNKMILLQKGYCAICGKQQIQFKSRKAVDLAIDHNHKTGEIRGLLCNKCNMNIAFLENLTEIQQNNLCNKIIKYLNRPEGATTRNIGGGAVDRRPL